jgi:hypothetical protein
MFNNMVILIISDYYGESLGDLENYSESEFNFTVEGFFFTKNK